MHCPPDDLCATCWDEQHRAEHPVAVDGCFACQLDSIQFSAKVAGNGRDIPPAKARNSWERGLALTAPRADGSQMPILKDGREVGVKEWASIRSANEEHLRRDSQVTHEQRLQEAGA